MGKGSGKLLATSFALCAEAVLPLLVDADGPKEIDLAEGGPVGVAEIELTIGTLPQEEAREADLAARPDDYSGSGKS